jgi:HPr kinase/phosphorylase
VSDAEPPVHQLHATAVARDGLCVLLRGPSGAGKSDLALRLIAAGWALVADDRTDVRVADGVLWASCPASIKGRIEARGVGILPAPTAETARVALLCDLGPGPHPRLPEPPSETILGVAVARAGLDPFEESAAAKIDLAVDAAAAV